MYVREEEADELMEEWSENQAISRFEHTSGAVNAETIGDCRNLSTFAC
jgi:hypothetical protein